MSTETISHIQLELENLQENNVIADERNDCNTRNSPSTSQVWPVSHSLSTPNVTFDLIESDDDIQELINFSEDIQITHETQNFRDSCNSIDETIPATPPTQDLSHWDDRNVNDYLFKTSNLNKNTLSTLKKTKSSKKISYKGKKNSKRSLSAVCNKRPFKIKKIEGYCCKLNGKLYQVISRDLDVLEALEKGLNDIKQKLQHYNGQHSIRHLCLQLNQIEIVLGVLEDDRLELGMSQEAWNEMILCAKTTFRDTQLAVDLCRKKILNLSFSTDDELSTSFSQNLIISPETQTSGTSRGQIPMNEEPYDNIHRTKRSLGNSQSICHSSSQFSKSNAVKKKNSKLDSSRSTTIPSYNGCGLRSVDKETGNENLEDQTLLRGKTLSSKNKVKKVNASPQVTSFDKVLPKRYSLLQKKPTHSNEELSSPLFEDSFVSVDLSPSNSQEPFATLDMENQASQNVNATENSLGFFPDHSTENASRENLRFDKQSTSLNANQALSFASSCLSFIRDTSVNYEGINKATNDQEDDCTIYDTEILQPSLSSQNLRRKCEPSDQRLRQLSKIVRMNFHFRPYVVAGLLNPGKNVLKMNFNNRVYIASLAVDGAIEMNGFTFPNVGYWIKSVEGKRFGSFPKRVQRTLTLYYNDSPLDDVLELEKQPVILKNVYEYSQAEEIIQSRTFKASTAGRNLDASKDAPTPITNNELSLQLIPDEMTRQIQNILLHPPEEYFPTCQCIEHFWNGTQPFPKHILDEIDSW